MIAAASLSIQQLESIEALADSGFPVRAWQNLQEATAGRSLPFPLLSSPDELVLAGRLCWQLGSAIRSAWYFRAAYRNFPLHPRTIYYQALRVFESRGPIAAWRFISEHGDLPSGVDPMTQASWFALQGQIAGVYRDFGLADRWLSKAESLNGSDGWVEVCRAGVLEREDRCDEALAILDSLTANRAGYRSAIQARGSLLVQTGRDEEAFEYLSQQAKLWEHSVIAAQACSIALALDRLEACETLLQRYEDLAILRDKKLKVWLNSNRFEIAYRQNHLQQAAQLARETKLPTMIEIADRLESPNAEQLKRVKLDVPYVRQHHHTCVPATLTSIGRFWSKPVDHLQIAEEICYDGTSALNERRWATRNGWHVREFSVSPSTTRALIDAGIPFTLTTVWPTGAHLQAVMGYDDRKQTLLIRDPSSRGTSEALMDRFINHFESSGPRGMAMVPADQASRLEAIELPDTKFWDLAHQLDAQLEDHHRDEALETLGQLERDWRDHPVRMDVQRRLAIYDRDLLANLEALNTQLERFPKDDRVNYYRLACLRDLGRRDDLLATYEQLCQNKEVHPVLRLQYAWELSRDASRTAEVDRHLRYLGSEMPTEASALALEASRAWERQQIDEAIDLTRFAACLEDRIEQYANDYFFAARGNHRTDEALTFLEDRFRRFGSKSGLPARTLFNALNLLERSQQALDVLSDAMTQRPDDGSLKLFAAISFAATDSVHLDRSWEWLIQTQPLVSRTDWLLAASQLSQLKGDLNDALMYRKQLVDLQPFSVEQHNRVAQLLADTQGTAAAVAYLLEATEKYPNYRPLWELRVSWLRDEPDAIREPVIRRAIELDSRNAWARRELVLLLAGRGAVEEAAREFELAEQLEPNQGATLRIRAFLQTSRNEIAEARESYRAALRLEIDDECSINELFRLAETQQQMREELDFLRGELQRQVVFGQGLLSFRYHAINVYPADELLEILQEAHQRRPDMWESWLALAGQLRLMERLTEARELLEQAVVRFSMLPRAWLELAKVALLQQDHARQIEALEAGFRLNPSWTDLVLQLHEARNAAGDTEGAVRVLEQSLARDPLNPALLVAVARVRSDSGDHETAIQLVERAIENSPAYDAAWDCLLEFSRRGQQPDRPLQFTRLLLAQREHLPELHVRLAQCLTDESQARESLEHLDQAIRLSPRLMLAHQLRIEKLFETEGEEAALKACSDEAWPDAVPTAILITRAKIFRSLGRTSEALELLKQVVASGNQSGEACTELAELARFEGDTETLKLAGEELIRIAPYFEYGYGVCGECLLHQHKTTEAIAMFERALALSPSYEYAGNMLFDLRFEAGQFELADTLIQELFKLQPTGFVLIRVIRIALQQKRIDEALAHFHQLLRRPMADASTINLATESLINCNLNYQVQDAFGRYFAECEPVQEVEIAYGTFVAFDPTLGAQRAAKAAKEGLGSAVIGFFEAYNYEFEPACEKLAFEFWRQAATTDIGWSTLIHFLYRHRQNRQLITVSRDWRNRATVTTQTYREILETFYLLGKSREAAEVLTAALKQATSEEAAEFLVYQHLDSNPNSPDLSAKLLNQIQDLPQAKSPSFRFGLALLELRAGTLEQHRDLPMYTLSASERLTAAAGAYSDFRIDKVRRRWYRQTTFQMMKRKPGLVELIKLTGLWFTAR